MSDIVVFTIADYPIRISAFVIGLGLLLCGVLFIKSYYRVTGRITEALAEFSFGFVLSCFLGRLLHWYFNAEMYGSSFAVAFTNFDIGSFVLPAAIVGVWAASYLVHWLHPSSSRLTVLDALAPPLALLFAFVRISALFSINKICRGKMTIADGIPFPTFLVSAVLMFCVFLLLKRMEKKQENAEEGDVWYWFVLLYAVVSVVMDSTRSDSPLMHFQVLSSLNQFSAFVSLGQVMPAIFVLVITIKWSIRSIRVNGLQWYTILAWLLFAASLFGIGFLGEYKIQRTAQYLLRYPIMCAFCCLLLFSEYLLRYCGEKTRA